jgi:hypothetical protein
MFRMAGSWKLLKFHSVQAMNYYSGYVVEFEFLSHQPFVVVSSLGPIVNEPEQV